MPTKSATNFAILGLLSIKPMSAYELVKFSKETIGFFWNESYGNIYSKLKTLADSGYIDLVKETKLGRPKKIYAINPRGKDYLKQWLKKAPEEIILRDELLLKLFISEKPDLKHARLAVQQEKEEMNSALYVFEVIQKSIQNLDQDPTRKELWLLTLEYGVRYAHTRRDWCREAIKKLKLLERKNNDE